MIPERPLDLDYELPTDLVAQHPPAERDGGRLLVLGRTGPLELGHRRIRDLPRLFPPRSLLVVNEARVEAARLHGTRPTGGKMELLVLVARDADFDALAQASKAIRIGSEVTAGGSVFRVLVDLGQGRYRFSGDVRRALERAGEVPLPPYIRRAPEPADADRYQTVYAREPGAVAAPTAGLHFTPELLDALRASGHTIASIWLAVGPGTFRPVRAARLAEHEMDEERFRVPPETAREIGEAKRQGRPVVAVGTTVVRALESMTGPGEGRTRLFIRPPFEFRTVDALLTNFHLPRSTLLALVAAFAGTERILTAYRAAVAERYRFYSYGDAMLIS